jgi:hypothetical protein
MLLLIKMYPEQIGRHWGDLKPAIEIALPKVSMATMDRMNKVFQALLCGQMDMYLVCEDESRKIRGLITSAIFQTIDMAEKQLLIYTIYAFGQATFDELREAWMLVKDLAKGNDCTSIVGYTAKENVLKLVKGLGAETDLTFVRMEV